VHVFTRYLSVHSGENGIFRVSITGASPIALLQEALRDEAGLRYSPILPAYLVPEEAPPPIPDELTSVAFFFSRIPHKTLGSMKPGLASEELERVYFTQGLASILCFNCDLPRAHELLEHVDHKLLEYWPLRKQEIDFRDIVIENCRHDGALTEKIDQHIDATAELSVYIEQIFASVVTLRQSYAIYNPQELKTLDQIALLTRRSIEQYLEASTRDTTDVEEALANVKSRNAVVSALAEISASLSYAVTQGTSGCSPILANPSPFPHFSLLGVGGAVRALTKFTRYLESAFSVRDASEVIAKGFSCRNLVVPAAISKYNSGDEYRFSESDDAPTKEFDQGGEFHQKNGIPLLVHLSLRHGFKESKFAITAASETLTTEILPQWTLITLSHEIMHNRVRQIFQTLFGAGWDQERGSVLSEKHYLDFKDFYESREEGKPCKLDCAIRNVILNFCYAMDRAMDIRNVHRRSDDDRDILGLDDLGESYGRHKLRAMELFVHFHDYYFSYACQPMMYTMSLWASWTGVAAPYTWPMDYLIRTLATIACGTGAKPDPAFEQASDIFEDALDALERSGTSSPLFNKLRELLKVEEARARFKPSYYLIDQVARFFASSEIVSRIDRIEDDPFAEGSASADNYSANVFTYGEEDGKSFVSPIRFSIASLLRSMLGESPIKDPQWLTAWNTIVISSQEVR